jgi:hypothetical protein
MEEANNLLSVKCFMLMQDLLFYQQTIIEFVYHFSQKLILIY